MGETQKRTVDTGRHFPGSLASWRRAAEAGSGVRGAPEAVGGGVPRRAGLQEAPASEAQALGAGGPRSPSICGAQGAPQAEPPEPCPGGPKLCRLGLQIVPNVRGFPQGGFNEPWESREGGSHQDSRSCQRHSPPRCESRRVFFTALGPPPLHLLPLPSPWLVLPVRSPRGLSSRRVSALTLGWRP